MKLTSAYNVNTNWCRAIVDSLVRLGVRDAVVSPGTRSAAMVSALRECGAIRLFILTDERSAGFFALGLARSTGRPAVTCVTSGSAVANLLPALTEAHSVRAPLVILSCDRPKRLRGAGLPQTTLQAEFCRPLVAKLVDLEDPTHEESDIDDLQARLAELSRYLNAGPDRGPVQINAPQDGKLTSVDGIHGWSDKPNEPPPVKDEVTVAVQHGAPPDLDALSDRLSLRPGMKGLIVAGPDGLVDEDLIRLLSEETGFPLLADAAGSVRGFGIPSTIAEGDILISQREFMFAKPDMIIRLGSAPVSSSLQQFLTASSSPVIRIDTRPVAADFTASSFELIVAPDRATIAGLAERLKDGDGRWRAQWLSAANKCREYLPRIVDEIGWCEVQAVVDALHGPAGDFVHVSNSLALRLVNLLLPVDDAHRQIFANRGVSGIDGTYGTFFGEAAGLGVRGLLILGDLAALHDIPALEACIRGGFRGQIVILNNGGGGLFDLLPVRTLPDYEPLIRNRNEVDFSAVARAFGVAHTLCRNRTEMASALHDPTSQEGIHIIEAAMPPGSASQSVPQLLKHMAQAQQ
ncbi:MAG: 2-succinyl-5-enolpyruvyl-6-hydroxy-3-cyclohexene-1-carboxylic-acid synthase [Parvularculaceae bacterium]